MSRYTPSLSLAPGEATVRLPGSCGELVQGSREGIPFHVTCPIDIYTTVQVKLGHGAAGGVKGQAHTSKAQQALAATLEFLGQGGLEVELAIHSPLPRGKGMASSTADVAGTIMATALALGKDLGLDQVARLALAIEPSDGTFFPGIVAFDHRGGRLYQPLGLPPPIDMLILDPGGEVDTLAFNRQVSLQLVPRLEPQAAEALEMVREGIAQGNPELIGQGATLSALAHQAILFKSMLERVLSLAQQVGALGINVAHSGTVIGVLLDPRQHDASALARFFSQNLPCLENIYTARLVGGGAVQAKGMEESPLSRRQPWGSG